MATDTRNTDYATKYKKELDQAFSANSFTEKFVTREDSFKEDGGVASVYFRTVDTSDFLAGHTGPVFTDPTSVQSDVVRKDVELFYQINKVIPSVDADDSAGALAAAGEILSTGIREQYAPLMDKLRFATAIAAAEGYASNTNVVTYDANDVMGGLDKMIVIMKNQRSTADNEAIFIPASVEPLLDAELLSKFTPGKNDSIISKGVIGTYKGVQIVVVPDDLFVTMTTTGTAPYAQAEFTATTAVKAIIWDKRILKDCRKLYKTFVLTGKAAITAGADGPVLRGLFRPGSWVVDANGSNKSVAILKAA